MTIRGQQWEQRAARWLGEQGLVVLARNYRTRCGEIDIIAREGAQLVFVEVRARSNPRYGGALASVDRHKQRRLLNTAGLYLQRHPEWAERPCRFDVIAFEPSQSGRELRPQWIRGAFTA